MTTTRTGLVTLPATATAAEIKAATDRDGAVIIQGVLTLETVARINNELDPILMAQDTTSGYSDDESRSAFYGRRTRRLQSIAARSDTVVEAMVDPRMLEWVGKCLTWGTEFSLNSAQIIDIGPGEPAQVLHRDEDLWPQVASVAPGEIGVSCMLALSDFTEATGATRVVVTTQRAVAGETDAWVAEDTVAAVMSAGDALYFTGTVVHGGGANQTTDQWRRGLVLSFILGWVQTEEAHTLAISVERAAQLPPRLRELLGFASYRAEMGEMNQLDMRDPYLVLFDEPRPER